MQGAAYQILQATSGCPPPQGRLALWEGQGGWAVLPALLDGLEQEQVMRQRQQSSRAWCACASVQKGGTGHVAQERQHAALGWSLLRKSQDEDIKALKHTLSLRRASMASAESSEGLANRHHRQQRPAPARPQQEWQAAKFRRVRYRCLKHFLLQ